MDMNPAWGCRDNDDIDWVHGISKEWRMDYCGVTFNWGWNLETWKGILNPELAELIPVRKSGI